MCSRRLRSPSHTTIMPGPRAVHFGGPSSLSECCGRCAAAPLDPGCKPSPRAGHPLCAHNFLPRPRAVHFGGPGLLFKCCGRGAAAPMELPAASPLVVLCPCCVRPRPRACSQMPASGADRPEALSPCQSPALSSHAQVPAPKPVSLTILCRLDIRWACR
ncbi:hypothetical protein NDU88_004798 [Pleurodeles waltl]|uniref:Uncharacterized protein n=1 Tax=Pleurodeles waltl TaxID=8319 RepID=A0AAV7PE51_PLEWA|nr:hypothetical protein NDU88_004798 [Pleurodeles waltl]